MFSKIIFALAMVCVVNASVLTASDDDPEIEVASNYKRCDLQSCENLCRRLNLPGGACVNGRCKCDHFLNAEDGDSDFSLSDLENSFSQQDDTEADDTARCNVKACDWVCRMLNKTSGSCVEGRCKCEKSYKAEVKQSDLEDLVSLTDDPETVVASISKRCDLQSCEKLCRRFNFTGGACVNGRCKCDNFLNAEDDLESEVEASLNRCNVKACDWVCRRLNMTSGSCANGHCQCEKSPTAEDAVTEPNIEGSVPIKACNNKKCNQLCRKQKFRGGSCLGANCYCNKFLSVQDEDAVDEYSELAVARKFIRVPRLKTRRVCKQAKCYRKCSRRGYEGATCIKYRCKCYNILKTPLTVSKLSEDPIERGCNMQTCDKLCHRLQFPGGTCVNGSCKCDNFFGSEDASSLNDDTSDGNEESDDILTDEDELTASAPSACNTVVCNQMCHHHKYAGGWCRFGQCKCY